MFTISPTSLNLAVSVSLSVNSVQRCDSPRVKLHIKTIKDKDQHSANLDQWIKKFINKSGNIEKIEPLKTKQIWDAHKQLEDKYRGEHAKDPGKPKLKFRGFVHFNENGIIDNVITQDPKYIEQHHEFFCSQTDKSSEKLQADGVKEIKDKDDDICHSVILAKDKWIGFQIQFKYDVVGKLQKINILPGSNTFGYAHPHEKDVLKEAVIEHTGLLRYLKPKPMCQLMGYAVSSSQMDIEITCEYKEKNKKKKNDLSQ